MSLSDPYAKVYLLHQKEEDKFKEQMGTNGNKEKTNEEKETEIIISKHNSRTSTHSNQLSPRFEHTFNFCVSFWLVLFRNITKPFITCNRGINTYRTIKTKLSTNRKTGIKHLNKLINRLSLIFY